MENAGCSCLLSSLNLRQKVTVQCLRFTELLAVVLVRVNMRTSVLELWTSTFEPVWWFNTLWFIASWYDILPFLTFNNLLIVFRSRLPASSEVHSLLFIWTFQWVYFFQQGFRLWHWCFHRWLRIDFLEVWLVPHLLQSLQAVTLLIANSHLRVVILDLL